MRDAKSFPVQAVAGSGCLRRNPASFLALVKCAGLTVTHPCCFESEGHVSETVPYDAEMQLHLAALWHCLECGRVWGILFASFFHEIIYQKWVPGPGTDSERKALRTRVQPFSTHLKDGKCGRLPVIPTPRRQRQGSP